MACYKLKKEECKLNGCSWIIGKGCKKNDSPANDAPKACYKMKKNECKNEGVCMDHWSRLSTYDDISEVAYVTCKTSYKAT